MTSRLTEFLKRLTYHLVAFVAITILIAAAPLISLAALVAPMFDYRFGVWSLCWFGAACPFCVGIWYMFVASLTRYARANREGCKPRTGFFWAGGRLFGGLILSYGLVVAFILIGEALLGTDVRGANIPEHLAVMLPTLCVLVWSPVLVNLTRHFVRAGRNA